MTLNTVSLCEYVGTRTWRVFVMKDGKLESFGSAVAISADGNLLTAKHVVSDGKKMRGEAIVCRLNRGERGFAYRCATPADLAIDTGAVETRPFDIDLALLQPVEPLPMAVDYVPLRYDVAPIGEEVVAAGFADDVPAPLFMEESFRSHTPEGGAMAAEFKQKRLLILGLLVKRRMIGCKYGLKINDFEAAHYVLDTELTYGASGGPVVDFEGRLVAIIARRGFSTGAKSHLPSSTASALSHHLLTRPLGLVPVAEIKRP
jgi:hypothetical protein